MSEDVSARSPMARPVWIATVAIAGSWLDAVVPSWRLSPDLGHAWAVPLLVGFLYWDRWSERPDPVRAQPTTAAWFAAAALLLVAVPIRLLLTPYPLWPSALLAYTGVAVGIAAIGATVIAGTAGRAWLLRPLLLALACIPIPTVVDHGVLLPLRTGIAAAVAEVSNLLGHPAIAGGTSIRLANGWVGVEEACSGIRSLQAALLFGLFFGEWFRFGWRRRAALVAVALVAAIAGNFGRVLFLTLYVANGGVADHVHDSAGWIAMLASFAATTWLAAHWGHYRLPASVRANRARATHARPGAWLYTVAASFVIVAIGTHAWFHPTARESAVPQWTAQLPTDHWSFKPEPLNDYAREMLRPDRFISGRWKDDGDRSIESYYIEWTHGQVARSVPFLHNPTVCLPYAGCELKAKLEPIDVPSAAGPVRFFTYRFQRAGESLLVSFTIWDPSRGQLLERPETRRNWWDWLRRQWRDVSDRRRDQPGQLLAVSMSGDDRARTEMEHLLRTLVVSSSVSLRHSR